MKCSNPSDVIYKDVVVIGNGPSGIILSYLLSGNIPYVISDAHPDEMLSARLKSVLGQSLIFQDLDYLSKGLEGRTTNPVSLLMDALLQPCADIGLELEPLVEFRKNGCQIDHIVLGKGPPGGSWHYMDPQILTLSLASWMALPGLKFHTRDTSEKRAYASSVAKYYVRYTEKMGLSKNFRDNTKVVSVKSLNSDENVRARAYKNTWVRASDKGCVRILVELEKEEKQPPARSCFISNALKCLMNRKEKYRCKRSREEPVEKEMFLEKKRYCDETTVPLTYKITQRDSNWLVTATDTNTGDTTTYSCKYLVLANGSSDQPNKLECSKGKSDPDWLVYDLRSLERKLEEYLVGKNVDEVDPVLIVGAGLSAADAVIAVRGRNVPVAHVFRNRSPDLSKQLPENLYPEYHKVNQMMLDGGYNYPLYTAYPEYNLTDFDQESRTVTLSSKDGDQFKVNVSFAVVLIGSRPDLSFLPQDFSLGVRKDLPVDCKTNPVDIDPLTYRVRNYENLFVIGPLAGDNFVRFLPGGALAVTAELYRRNKMR